MHVSKKLMYNVCILKLVNKKHQFIYKKNIAKIFNKALFIWCFFVDV